MADEKVLVIEDNPMNMQLSVDLLEMGGFIVIQAQTAEKGIELAKAELPDLILMDISLPGMDGLTATGILKQHPDIKYVPIVALTAHAMRGDDEKAFAAGCIGYITKPIDTKTFHKTVTHYIKSEAVLKDGSNKTPSA